MAESVLKNKTILAVDDEADVLTGLEEEMKEASPTCILDKTTTYREAKSWRVFQ